MARTRRLQRNFKVSGTRVEDGDTAGRDRINLTGPPDRDEGAPAPERRSPSPPSMRMSDHPARCSDSVTVTTRRYVAPFVALLGIVGLTRYVPSASHVAAPLDTASTVTAERGT